jgi:hypothetical protein
MFGEREKRWMVSIVTRTNDTEAIRVWTMELTKRECEFVIVEPSDVWELMVGDEIDAFLVDDVFPPATPEMRQLSHVLTRMRPEPAIVFLVAKWDDYHHLCDLVDGRALIHHDGTADMDQVYDYLAGLMNGDKARLF